LAVNSWSNDAKWIVGGISGVVNGDGRVGRKRKAKNWAKGIWTLDSSIAGDRSGSAPSGAYTRRIFLTNYPGRDESDDLPPV
jgi:hypothetical protein